MRGKRDGDESLKGKWIFTWEQKIKIDAAHIFGRDCLFQLCPTHIFDWKSQTRGLYFNQGTPTSCPDELATAASVSTFQVTLPGSQVWDTTRQWNGSKQADTWSIWVTLRLSTQGKSHDVHYWTPESHSAFTTGWDNRKYINWSLSPVPGTEPLKPLKFPGDILF